MTTNLLDHLTQGRTLPAGTDRWAIRSVHPDLMSSRGFRWPFPGSWAEAGGPFVVSNKDGCPVVVGDGLCAAVSWRGMASGSIPALTLLLVAFADADVLGWTEDEGKLRARRVFVVEVVDGARLLREHGSGANLTDADLRGANLTRADLTDANLRGADLRGARVSGSTVWPEDFDHASRGVVPV